MSEPLLEVSHLRFRWPGAPADTLAIDSFSMQRGDTVFLRGASGGGKSTLLSLLAGVLAATEGRVALLGRDWRALRAGARDAWRAEHLGYIFQQFNLLPYQSALDNALLPLRFSRARAAAVAAAGDATAQAGALLRRMGLAEADLHKPAGRLSVGQQQRVAAARALLGRPALVLADEPTSALDEDAREQFMALLLAAVADAGAALLFVSHDERLGPRFSRQMRLADLAPRPASAA